MKSEALIESHLWWRLASSCEHPMIVRREDGGTYCTECGARVA